MRKLSWGVIVGFVLTISTPCSLAQNKRAGLDVLAKGGTLHEATKAAGGTLMTMENNLGGWISYASAKDLARASSVIVVIRPDSNQCRLSSDGRSIETVYTVTVLESLHGPLKAGDKFIVAIPGGRFSWPDGSTAQVNTPGLRKMVDGSTYVLFATSGKHRRNNNELQELIPVGVKAGLFELKSDGTVDPNEVGMNSALSNRYRGKDANWFLNVARRLSQERTKELKEKGQGTNEDQSE